MPAKYLIIDTETTGFYPSKHGLIQAAFVVCDEKMEILFSYCKDICPPKNTEISQESLQITGFTVERIQKGVSYTEFCAEFLGLIKNYFPADNKPILIGQFYPFDFAFLQSVFASINLQNEFNQALDNDFIDTKVLANFANLKANFEAKNLPFQSTSLSKENGLKKILKVESTFTAHDALQDVLATREVLLKFIDWYK